MLDWALYYEYDEKLDSYIYIDKSVIELPHNLPMPPTTNISYMFANCKRLKDITSLANWDVSNVKDISYMFANCASLHYLSALVNWDVSNIENCAHMFDDCILIPQYIRNKPYVFILYIYRCMHDIFLKDAKQRIVALRKENTELKTRLAYLERKYGF